MINIFKRASLSGRGGKRKRKVPTYCGVINEQGEIFGHFTKANSFKRDGSCMN